MRLSRQQLADNEAKIRAAMTRLLSGDIPPGGKCDIKTLALQAGVDRTAFYGSRPYAHLREEFEQRLQALQQAGERPDPRDAQIARLKDEGNVSIIMILHNYVHVFAACDRVSLIQDGVIALDKPTAETSVEELTEIVVNEYRRAREAARAAGA